MRQRYCCRCKLEKAFVSDCWPLATGLIPENAQGNFSRLQNAPQFVSDHAPRAEGRAPLRLLVLACPQRFESSGCQRKWNLPSPAILVTSCFAASPNSTPFCPWRRPADLLHRPEIRSEPQLISIRKLVRICVVGIQYQKSRDYGNRLSSRSFPSRWSTKT